MALDNTHDLNSLGFAKAPHETRVVVAMSGGVDSSVVAAELASQGYDVVGVTLQLYDHGAALAKKGACCAGRDIHDARRVAETDGLSALRARLRERRFATRSSTNSPTATLPVRRPFPASAATSGSSSATCSRPRATSRPTAWRPAITSSARWAPRAPSCTRRPTPRATSPTSCSRRPPSSSPTCASRSAISHPRPRRGRLPRATGWRWPTSPTARTSASCRTAIMPA